MSSPPRSSADEPWPVRTVSRVIGDWVGRLGTVWVEGQVTGLSRRPGLGTAFLTLRDTAANVSLPAVVAPGLLDALTPPLGDGARVVVLAQPEWRFDRGTLQLRVVEVRPVGVGALLAQLERLRGVLQQEGLFDPARKRPLPFLPRTVGLVTGRESAARRDVEDNARLRWPAVRIVVREVAVQGVNAVPAVTAALQELDRDAEVDVIVIARGGGSVEDLLPFSDESLCRAVAACRTPVVSAIGHEGDSPLLDLVADVRASTPTDAAKRVVPDVVEEHERVLRLRRSAWRCVAQRVSAEQAWLGTVRSRPVVAAPERDLDQRAADVSALATRSTRVLAGCLDQGDRDVTHLRAQVAALSPAATLERGYAVVQDISGAVVRDAAQVDADDALAVRLARGRLTVRVTAAADQPTA